MMLPAAGGTVLDEASTRTREAAKTIPSGLAGLSSSHPQTNQENYNDAALMALSL
jgi:hypothetical protein